MFISFAPLLYVFQLAVHCKCITENAFFILLRPWHTRATSNN